jgi:histidinol-phosphate/aromatic aminotransferase/cobyric acid decarboxylase-like protein
VTLRSHGGPDAQGSALRDFSTCAHLLGPCPGAWQAVQAADARRYPDPDSTTLRLRLAAHHGVEPDGLLLAASASEFIQRITASALALHDGPVVVPVQAYGDYAAAAQACGRPVVVAHASAAVPAALRWCADPPCSLLTRLHALEPSWPLGAHAVAMLNAWCEPDTAIWLAGTLPALAQARAALMAGLVQRGFAPRPGVAPNVCVRLPARWYTAAPARRGRARLQQLRPVRSWAPESRSRNVLRRDLAGAGRCCMRHP